MRLIATICSPVPNMAVGSGKSPAQLAVLRLFFTNFVVEGLGGTIHGGIDCILEEGAMKRNGEVYFQASRINNGGPYTLSHVARYKERYMSNGGVLTPKGPHFWGQVF